MPFIAEDRRVIMDLPDLRDVPDDFKPEPGDLCYKYYKPMVTAWRKEPRWTTAHNLYVKLLDDRKSLAIYHRTFGDIDGEIAALDLAWQVFFHLHVMPYELKKREENGDI